VSGYIVLSAYRVSKTFVFVSQRNIGGGGDIIVSENFSSVGVRQNKRSPSSCGDTVRVLLLLLLLLQRSSQKKKSDDLYIGISLLLLYIVYTAARNYCAMRS